MFMCCLWQRATCGVEPDIRESDEARRRAVGRLVQPASRSHRGQQLPGRDFEPGRCLTGAPDHLRAPARRPVPQENLRLRRPGTGSRPAAHRPTLNQHTQVGGTPCNRTPSKGVLPIAFLQ